MGKKPTSKQTRALPLLASGLSGAETAKIVGVKPSTVSQWLNHCPDFMESLEELRGAGMRQAMGQLQGTLTEAVDELRRILTTSKTDAVRLKAAQFIIEAYGITKERNQAHLDPVSRAELAVVGDILKGLVGNRATA
ncbi:MAG: helix-turn-helix domain-containing protein [Dechloromonas sp.]|uniref:Helix-turn-helix domain-containing protein n=1 Tax=Candidatus Dechloromonas phosphorivorans TaxID=2899244 RepID=A0A9D7LQX2_9RHOO|nr:helix-turn-helix domain-containing protein [Candidatus Dechloromonas phosphorivorans]